MNSENNYKYVIIGGGVSGMVCAQTLALYQPEAKIAILSVTPVLKSAVISSQSSDHIINFDIKEKSFEDVCNSYNNIDVFCGNVYKLNSAEHSLSTSLGLFKYEKLLVATGGKPKCPFESPYVVGLRDIDSIFYLTSLLKDAKRVIVYGNGGVAIDFINTITNVDVVWIYKHDYIGHTFLDKVGANFVSPYITNHKDSSIETHEGAYVYNIGSSQNVVTDNDKKISSDKQIMHEGTRSYSGTGVGPCWHKTFKQLQDSERIKSHQVLKEDCSMIVAYRERGGQWFTLDHQPYTEAVNLENTESREDQTSWNLQILLTNGKVYGCDFLLTAIGVNPNIDFIKNDDHYSDYERTPNQELVVDEHMQVQGVEDIYAAGDVCKVHFSTPVPVNKPRVWFQMKLWSQYMFLGLNKLQKAYLLGKEAALNMITKEDLLEKGLCFDLFAHCTYIFGFKVVLLGLYNGQNLPKHIQKEVEELPSGEIEDSESGIHIDILRRVIPGKEMVKLVILNNRLVGAILIGETDLEEALENLILNRFNIGDMKSYILDPEFNLEDYFD